MVGRIEPVCLQHTRHARLKHAVKGILLLMLLLLLFNCNCVADALVVVAVVVVLLQDTLVLLGKGVVAFKQGGTIAALTQQNGFLASGMARDKVS